MPTSVWFLLAVAAVSMPGCSALLGSTSAPPVYYQLEYDAPSVPCSHPFSEAVRVWGFTASSPFDRPEMVVVREGGEVLYSAARQWVATPGNMISQSLLRDFDDGSLFPRAVSAEDPTVVPLDLTGRVFSFAWEKRDASVRAALQVDVSLTEAGKERRLLFRRRYALTGPPSSTDTAAGFASAMSSLMREFSERLQRGLCRRSQAEEAKCASAR